jgi:hypothetical protein
MKIKDKLVLKKNSRMCLPNTSLLKIKDTKSTLRAVFDKHILKKKKHFFENFFVTPNMALRPFIGLSPDPCAELHNTKPSLVQKG